MEVVLICDIENKASRDVMVMSSASSVEMLRWCLKRKINWLGVFMVYSCATIRFIFFPGLFFTLLSNFWLFGGLGVGVFVLGSWIGFLGVVISVNGVWGLGCGALCVMWCWGSLHEHRRINLGKKCCLQYWQWFRHWAFIQTFCLTWQNFWWCISRLCLQFYQQAIMVACD